MHTDIFILAYKKRIKKKQMKVWNKALHGFLCVCKTQLMEPKNIILVCLHYFHISLTFTYSGQTWRNKEIQKQNQNLQNKKLITLIFNYVSIFFF